MRTILPERLKKQAPEDGPVPLLAAHNRGSQTAGKRRPVRIFREAGNRSSFHAFNDRTDISPPPIPPCNPVRSAPLEPSGPEGFFFAVTRGNTANIPTRKKSATVIAAKGSKSIFLFVRAFTKRQLFPRQQNLPFLSRQSHTLTGRLDNFLTGPARHTGIEGRCRCVFE